VRRGGRDAGLQFVVECPRFGGRHPQPDRRFVRPFGDRVSNREADAAPTELKDRVADRIPPPHGAAEQSAARFEAVILQDPDDVAAVGEALKRLPCAVEEDGAGDEHARRHR
jgi:hypothetical protein